jgi:hypothetical protein
MVVFHRPALNGYPDFSNKYAPEMMIKHTGKKEKKSRKLKLPTEITPIFTDYVSVYKVDDLLFPYRGSRRYRRFLYGSGYGHKHYFLVRAFAVP